MGASKSSIILVEDDPTMLSALTTLLELEGFQVIVPATVRQVEPIVQIARETHPRTILLDVHLHGSSGFDVLRGLRAEGDLAGTHIIMSSGMAIKDQCIAAGADDFLLKPFMPDELIEKLVR